MKYVKYSNVSVDDLVVMTDAEYDSAWEAWSSGRPITLARLGVTLPQPPSLPCGVPYRLRGCGPVHLTGSSPARIVRFADGSAFLLSGEGPFGGPGGRVSWVRDAGVSGDPEELAERYRAVPLDDALAAGRVTQDHLDLLFSRGV